MIERLRKDVERRPDLFLWNGAVKESALQQWIDAHAWQIPLDLLALWTLTGGGDLFETETIFAPCDAASDESVECANDEHHSCGLNTDYVVFHAGLGLSAVQQSTARYVVMTEDDYSIRSEYRSLEAWYSDWLRAEYAERYGLESF